MNPYRWRVAIITEFGGLAIATLALIGDLLTTTTVSQGDGPVDNHILIRQVVGCLVPIFLMGCYTFVIVCLRLGNNTPSLALATAGFYLNSVGLGTMVYLAGGVHGLFTPLYLVIPHTAAVFLARTVHQAHILYVVILTLGLYLILSLIVPSREVTAYAFYSFFYVLVLAGSIALEIYLTFVTSDARFSVGSGSRAR